MDKLTKIEEKYHLNDLDSWQLLRNPYHFYIDNQNLGVSNIKTYTSKLNKMKRYIKNLFFGFRNWFRSYDYIIFDVNDDYKNINNSYTSRLTQELNNNLDKKKILHIQTILSNIDYKVDDYIVSNSMIHIIAKIISGFFTFKDNKIYTQINTNENIQLDFSSIYKILMARSFIIKLLLKMYKPKIVFITCYAKIPEILASKELGIKVVEIQHGIIDILPYKNNNIDFKLKPNYIFVFGKNDKKILEKTNYLENKNHIFVVGSYILEKTINSTNILDKYRKNYKQIVSISIQDPMIKETKSFIESVAKELRETLFILIPRVEKIDLNGLSSNIIIVEDKNCLEIVASSTWHITGSSTCAFESASLGIPNIFWNYKNFSKIYFEEYIHSKDYNFMVNTKNELIDILNKNYIFDKSDIISKNSDYYMNEYNKNIKNALSIIGKEEDESI